jgi:hypothetical protein
MNIHRFLVPGLLLLLIGVGGYLRLRDLGYSPIMGDQSILLNIAMRFVNEGKVPLAANKSSAGIMNPPLITYLLALPLWFSGSITAPHMFQGFIGIAAILAMAIYTKQLFGWRVALISIALFSFNSWAVYYSRFIWNPNPIPLFSTLMLMSLITYFAGRRQPIHLAASFVWLATITQLHLSGLVLVVAMGLILLFFWSDWWQRNRWQHLISIIVGTLIGLMLYWPYLRFQRAVGFIDIRAAMTALVGSETQVTDLGVSAARLNAASFLLVKELATGNNVWFALSLPLDTIRFGTWFAGISTGLFLLSLLYVVLIPILRLRLQLTTQTKLTPSTQAVTSQDKVLVILAIWIFVPILLFLRHSVYLQNYYFLYIFPAPFLAIALMLDHLMRHVEKGILPFSPAKIRQPIVFGLLIPVIGLCIWQFYLYQSWFDLVEEGIIVPPRQAFYVQQAIDVARQITAENPDCDLLLLGEGDAMERSSLGAIESFIYPTAVRYVDTERGYIIPAFCATYLTIADDALAYDWLHGNSVMRPEQIVAGNETWRFYEVYSSPGDNQSKVTASWQNGISLIQTEITGAAARDGLLTLNYTWHVWAMPPSGIRYHFFNHVIDTQGFLVAQDDTPAIDAVNWRMDDQLVTQFFLQLPADIASGNYSIVVGLYTWPELDRVSLLNTDETVYLVTTIEIP